jgi:uncharacterized membrane protein (UPF0127 family)
LKGKPARNHALHAPKIFLVALVLLAGWRHSPAIGKALAEEAGFAYGEITINAFSGPQRFQIEIARDAQSIAQGLMFRRHLPERQGMLFDFGREGLVAMWMKNTLIPLDMLFIAGDGRIKRIHEQAKPGDLTPIPSGALVRAVLEINGGLSSKLGLKAGDLVVHPIFANTKGRP